MSGRRDRLRLALFAVLAITVLTAIIATGSRPPSVPTPPPERSVEDRERTEPLPLLPEQAGSGALEGRVHRGGQGTAARVTVRRIDGLFRSDRIATVRTDDEGRFLVAGIGSGRYEVRAEASGGVAADALVAVSTTGSRTWVEIELPPGTCSLSGRAIWSDGRPFVGLVRGTAWIETGPDGRFRFRGLPAGTHELVFLVPGRFRSHGHAVALPAEVDPVLIVDEGVSELRGRVRSAADGRPVPGAVVTATGGMHFFTVRCEERVECDREGRFRVRVPLTYRRLQITADGFRPCPYHPPPSEREVEIALDPAHRVEGRVVNEDGEPVAGVPVFAISRGEDPAKAPAQVVSGKDGLFTLENVVADELVLFARGEGWVSRDLAAAFYGGSGPLVRSLGPGLARSITLVVVRAAAIVGSVEDATGRPVTGAVVECTVISDRWLPQGFDLNRSTVTTTATGADGRFRMTNVITGVKTKLVATAPGYVTGTARVHPPGPGQTAEVGIVLPAGGSIQVLALEVGSDRPVPGAKLEVALGPRPRFEVFAAATAGPDGKAEIGSLPARGVFQLRGHHPDFALPGPWTECRGGLPRHELRLHFIPGVSITGRVMMPDGTPASHGRVHSWPSDARGYPDRRRYAPVAAGGRFHLTGHPTGVYRLEADQVLDGRRYVGEAVAHAGDAEVVITLSLTAEEQDDDPVLRVRVLDADGRPVPRADVEYVLVDEIYDLGGSGAFTIYLGEGSCDIDRRAAGIWLRVVRARSLSNAPLPLGSAVVGPIAPDAGAVEIRLPRERFLSGRLIDPDGNGVPGVRVKATPADDSLFTTPAGEGITDEDGRFRIGGLGDGAYQLRCRVSGRVPASTLAAAGSTAVSLVLRKVMTTRIRVVDSAGKPVPGARVWVEGRSGGRGCNTNDAGEVLLSGFVAGERCRLKVTPTDGNPGAVIDPWSPTDTTVRLGAPHEIGGRVVDPSGAPLPDALIWCRPAAGTWTDHRADEEGRFTIGGLAPGAVTLIVRPEDTLPIASDSRAVTVTAGDRDVVLIYHPGITMKFKVQGWPGEGPWVTARLFDRAGKVAAECDVDEEGRIEFPAMDPRGVFSLWIPPLDDGRTLYLPVVRPRPEEVVLALSAGGLIRGRLVIPALASGLYVWVEGPGFELEGALFPDRTLLVTGVPAGELTLFAEAWIDGKLVRASARASRGDTVELTIPQR